MITVKNLTKQGREVIFRDGTEYVHYWLNGRESVTMPDNFITDTVNELARRKIISLKKTN
tara:strand:+ start:5543 stop:5722 length:180 start_codon:yes stop_codon:yes gene_type:complete